MYCHWNVHSVLPGIISKCKGNVFFFSFSLVGTLLFAVLATRQLYILAGLAFCHCIIPQVCPFLVSALYESHTWDGRNPSKRWRGKLHSLTCTYGWPSRVSTSSLCNKGARLQKSSTKISKLLKSYWITGVCITYWLCAEHNNHYHK